MVPVLQEMDFQKLNLAPVVLELVLNFEEKITFPTMLLIPTYYCCVLFTVFLMAPASQEMPIVLLILPLLHMTLC